MKIRLQKNQITDGLSYDQHNWPNTPIKKICEMAHSYGVEVMVDGAHCIGHFNFSLRI